MQQMMRMMWQGGMQHGMHPGMQGPPGGDTVYRPSLDFLTASSHTSTLVETQFTGDDLLSLHDMGIDFGDPDTPVQRVGPRRRKRRARARARQHPHRPRHLPHPRPRARPRPRLRLRDMPTRSWWLPPTIGRCWTRTSPQADGRPDSSRIPPGYDRAPPPQVGNALD